jgi:hypothetical protein
MKLGNHRASETILAGCFRHSAARVPDMTKIQKRMYTGWNGGLEVGWNVVTSFATTFRLKHDDTKATPGSENTHSDVSHH